MSASEALVQDAACLVASLSGALQKVLQLPSQVFCLLIRAEILLYRACNDPASASSFFEALSHYARASGLSEQEVL